MEPKPDKPEEQASPTEEQPSEEQAAPETTEAPAAAPETPEAAPAESAAPETPAPTETAPVEVELDGEQIMLTIASLENTLSALKAFARNVGLGAILVAALLLPACMAPRSLPLDKEVNYVSAQAEPVGAAAAALTPEGVKVIADGVLAPVITAIDSIAAARVQAAKDEGKDDLDPLTTLLIALATGGAGFLGGRRTSTTSGKR